MKRLLIIFLFCCQLCWADSSTLLGQKGADLALDSQLKARAVLKLNDAFLIQLFSSWKASGALEPSVNDWFQKIVEHRFDEALKAINTIQGRKVIHLKKAAELYLLYRLGMIQTFTSRWLEHASNGNFLTTELGLALDQVVGPNASQLFLGNGFALTNEMREQLKAIESNSSAINYSLQGLAALKSGERAVLWIGKLKETDPLRIHLAYTAILDYARQGKLGASGTLIKKIIEPWIEKQSDPEIIAHYYMTLGRLLYQARAFKESVSYYKLIPETSKYFLEARTESLWAHLQNRDFSSSLGELASLKMNVFSEQFYPEISLAGAIGHTMLCQFTDARHAIQSFVKNNRSWGRKIELAIKSDRPELIRETETSRHLNKQLNSLDREAKWFKTASMDNYAGNLEARTIFARELLRREAKQQWTNRYRLLDQALYKMKFVRIELLSRMKMVADGLKNQLAGADMVKRYQAATAKSNQIIFPADGMPWGDELFHMSADVINECIEGKFYEK